MTAVIWTRPAGTACPHARIAALTLGVLLWGCAAPEHGVAAHPGIRVIEPGAVYAASAAELVDLAEVGALGIRTVLDLDQENRADRPRVSRDDEMARERGVLFVHLPLDPLAAPSLAELDAAVDILREQRFQPILVHADHSDHRTRLVVAAYRVGVQGWTAERATKEMAEGSRWAPWLPTWRERLFEYAAVREGVCAPVISRPARRAVGASDARSGRFRVRGVVLVDDDRRCSRGRAPRVRRGQPARAIRDGARRRADSDLRRRALPAQ